MAMNGNRFFHLFATLLSVWAFMFPAHAGEEALWRGPMIDVHSQVDKNTDLDQIVPLMDKAGVAQVVISTRFRQPSSVIHDLAAQHPGRIIPAAKTKTRAFTKGRGPDKFPDVFYQELKSYDYRAMAEVIMWHAAKPGKGAGRSVIEADSPRLRPFVDTARQKGFPFVVHVEFGDMEMGEKDDYMKKLEALFTANQDVSFGMIHMGQLEAEDAAKLLPRHANLFFITSHSNPVTTKASGLPWTRMIFGTKMATAWEKVVLAHPDRFVLGFDNVWASHWRDKFLPQAELWRKVLAKLPGEVAAAIAHKNAERLWKLPPARLPER